MGRRRAALGRAPRLTAGLRRPRASGCSGAPAAHFSAARPGAKPFDDLPPPSRIDPRNEEHADLRSIGAGLCRRRCRHPVRPHGGRQHAPCDGDEEHRRHEHVLRPPRALRVRDGDGLPPRHRQGRRRLRHLRPGLHADHDRAHRGLARAHPARRLRRRGADARALVQSGARPAAARGRHRRPLHIRPQPAAHVPVCARGVLPRPARAQAGRARRALRPAEAAVARHRRLPALVLRVAADRARAAQPVATRRARGEARGRQVPHHRRRPRRDARRRRRRGRGARRAVGRAPLDHAARARHVRPQPVLHRGGRRLRARHRARSRRAGRPRRRHRLEPELLHRRRRPHVPQGRGGADRH